ncbi:MAG TPA: M48 family metallopeptidase [Bryobacteraceae bacterium]|nr:M48 family metallopeptidase [Bryobacteraceae bacterium]
MDQPGGCPAETVVRIQPLVVVQAAILQTILGEALHRFGCRTAEWRDGGVVQVKEMLPHREPIGIAFPNRQFRRRGVFLNGIYTHGEGHSFYNTGKRLALALTKPLQAALLIGMLAGATPGWAGKKDDPAQIGDRNVGRCLNFFSVEKEIALGKQLAEEVSREAKMSQDAVLGEFVNRTGQNLVRNSDAKVPFTFQVIEDDAPNAFALPGGFVFVNTGLIKLADEEDEFAGVLAHEIAHVAARHMTCRATKGAIAGAAGSAGGVLLGGLAGVAARQAMGLAIPAMFLAFSRADETEADYLGTQYLYAAGYDPNGILSIFEKLEALDRTQHGVAARIFSTHPMDATRIDKTEKEIQQILPARPEYVVTTSEYGELRRRLIDAEPVRKPAAAPTLRTPAAPGGAADRVSGYGRD